MFVLLCDLSYVVRPEKYQTYIWFLKEMKGDVMVMWYFKGTAGLSFNNLEKEPDNYLKTFALCNKLA